MREAKTITIVSPFFNEQDGAWAFYTALQQQMADLNLSYTFIFVDDGSRDGTLLVLNQIADQDERVTVLALSRNFGHQTALTAGLDFAPADDVVVVMDSDLQHPPETITDMLAQYTQGADIVYAVRNQPQNLSFAKRLTSDLFYSLMKRMTNIDFVPGAADFRMMAPAVVHSLRRMRETHRFLRGMVAWVGFDYAIVYYDQPNRQSGASSYTWRKMFRLAQHGIFSFSTIPLDLITWVGMLLTGLSFIYFVYIIGVVIAGDVVTGWTSTIGVLLLLGGVQLISIGVIAQYIGMIFEQTKERPLYVLRQRRLSEGVRDLSESDVDQPR